MEKTIPSLLTDEKITDEMFGKVLLDEHPITKFRIGDFVVIKGFSAGEIVCYIDDNYPFEDIKKLMDNGTLSYRTPSEIEKEYCFWFYNQISKNEGAKLSGLKEWELKFRNK